MTRQPGFGLYLHWPFCQAKCPYCDFNSHVSTDIDQRTWAEAFEAEISRVAKDVPDRYLNSVFFGGGTPSLMHPETIDRILARIRSTWNLANDLEVTLEANPTSTEAARFSAYADLGVNRVSIGVQSLDDQHLRKLGRLHSADEARSAVLLGKAYFERVSFDLIYARQDQSIAAWERELSEALQLATDHLSLYQLTVEPGTAFGERFDRGKLHGLPDTDLAADMYELTQEMTINAGLPAYEISNHARCGSESRHNLIYWRGHDWLGVGPGAHGRFWKGNQRIATETHLSPSAWLKAVENGNGESSRRVLPGGDCDAEQLMMGLRLSDGIPIPESSYYINKINGLVEIGMLEIAAGNVRATPSGKLLLNAVLRELLS